MDLLYPLAIRLERAKLLRDGGRTGELMAELQKVAQLQLLAGETEAAPCPGVRL